MISWSSGRDSPIGRLLKVSLFSDSLEEGLAAFRISPWLASLSLSAVAA
jgi:hypothetical protein